MSLSISRLFVSWHLQRLLRHYAADTFPSFLKPAFPFCSDGLGLSRCVLVYESGVGENRLQRVENDEWTAPMDLKTVPDQQQ